ncbi:MAG: hypothetical protein NTY68_03030 [Candidatus Micrarchaeota archaeon]|nr:hypothetical protein [Candidatus Micrarchaeota archaeon]
MFIFQGSAQVERVDDKTFLNKMKSEEGYRNANIKDKERLFSMIRTQYKDATLDNVNDYVKQNNFDRSIRLGVISDYMNKYSTKEKDTPSLTPMASAKDVAIGLNRAKDSLSLDNAYKFVYNYPAGGITQLEVASKNPDVTNSMIKITNALMQEKYNFLINNNKEDEAKRFYQAYLDLISGKKKPEEVAFNNK